MSSRVSITLRQLAVAVIMGLAGLFLLLDSTTFGLRPVDFEGKRAGGCYVLLDDLVGAKEPTEWARPTEFVISCGVILLTLGLGGRALWHGVFSRRTSG
jgi:hypothetical protein